MPFINDYSTLTCLKKKYFFNKKNYPLFFDNFFNNLNHYKIREKITYPHFPQIFNNNQTLSFSHGCGKCAKVKNNIKYLVLIDKNTLFLL